MTIAIDLKFQDLELNSRIYSSGHKLLEAYREYVKLGARSVMCLVESTTKTRQNRSEAA